MHIPSDITDIVEQLWTGQEVEIEAGPNVSELMFTQTPEKAAEQERQFGPILEEYGHLDTGVFIKRMNLASSRYRERPKRHELQFSLEYANRAALFMGAEIKEKEDSPGKYTLTIYFTNSLRQRLAVGEKPEQEVLVRTFGMMFRMLQAAGYVAKAPEPALAGAETVGLTGLSSGIYK